MKPRAQLTLAPRLADQRLPGMFRRRRLRAGAGQHQERDPSRLELRGDRSGTLSLEIDIQDGRIRQSLQKTGNRAFHRRGGSGHRASLPLKEVLQVCRRKEVVMDHKDPPASKCARHEFHLVLRQLGEPVQERKVQAPQVLIGR